MTGNVELVISNTTAQPVSVLITDNAYMGSPVRKAIAAGEKVSVRVESRASSGWYDASVRIDGDPNFEHRFAGRVETGKESISDPAMA